MASRVWWQTGGGSGYRDDSFGAYFCSIYLQKVTWDYALGFEPRPIDYTVPLAGDIPAVKFPVWLGQQEDLSWAFWVLWALMMAHRSSRWLTTVMAIWAETAVSCCFIQLFVYSRAKVLNCEGDFLPPPMGHLGVFEAVINGVSEGTTGI